jgi:peroxiredoxin family protein
MAEKKTKKRIAMIASKGTLDMAYPPLILATTAIAMDMEAGIFFTFYGLNIIKKSTMNSLKIAPLGNPAMPVPMPNIIGVLPGMTAMATVMMKSWMGKANVATIPQLIQTAIDGGVRLWACQMAMEVMGLKKLDLIDGIEDPVGAATFLDYAVDADISLFI